MAPALVFPTPPETREDDVRPGRDLRIEPIAICGMAMRLPGGIRNDADFWDVLVNAKDTRGPIPPTRYNKDGFTDRTGHKGAIKTQHGYFIEDDLTALDTSFFTLTKNELERTDPQQRQLLEIAREVLESAGEVDYRGELVGCYVGTFGEDWLQMSAKETQHTGGYIMTGHSDLMLANRVSFEYDLKGPSMVIKTGCSASLVGLHQACRAIQQGDCVAAIVAGSNLIMGPTTTAAMTEEGILSPEGSCKTFDAKADGFARGEAITAVYIKRLEDAIRDGNPIRAVIRNTGTNSDGKSQSLMSPNSRAHEALMRKVYADINLDPSRTGFVECHGTGTPTGDPLETTAVGEVFGTSGVLIGSVKPNVGHSEGASGVTSLIKGVLALEHSIIPPNIKFDTPNPKIPFEAKKLQVPTQATEWPSDREKRISINSFGIGGSNAHVIIESADRYQARQTRLGKWVPEHGQIAFVSANSQAAAQEYAGRIRDFIAAHPQDVNDLAYTLAHHRELLPFRAYLTVDGASHVEVSSVTKAPAETPSIVMVFSGQGAQWPRMGSDLIRSDPSFRQDIESMDCILQSLRHPPSWRIAECVDELQKTSQTSQLGRAELAQPLTTAIQIAIVERLRRAGIEPSAVVGHSSGEIAAAYASGAISCAEAIISAYYRGFVTKEQSLQGGMAALGLGVIQASSYLVDGVVVACDNSPSSVTISGDLDALHDVLARIKKDNPETLARQLKVDMAYHSYHMKSLGLRYQNLLEAEIISRGLTRQSLRCPMWSSVTGRLIGSGHELGPEYFRANLTSRVLFNSAIQLGLQQQSNILFLEIGPHSTLAGPIRQVCTTRGRDCVYIPSMLRGKDCEQSLLAAVGQLYQHGVPIDFESLFPVGRAMTNLPQYAWQHNDSYWYESRLSKAWRLRKAGHHALLGLSVPESTTFEPMWRNMLSLEDQPWIVDHKVGNDVVFPFAGYISMAGEAIRQINEYPCGYRIRHAIAKTALVLSDTTAVEVVTSLRPAKLSDASDSRWFEFTISSYSGSSWIKHCHGQVMAYNDVLTTRTPSEAKLPRHVPTARWYRAMEDIGILYGQQFQGLSEITSSTTENLAAATVTSPLAGAHAFLFHPITIDVCLQLLLVALAKGIGRNFGDLRIPTMIEDLVISNSANMMHAVAWSDGVNNAAIDCVADGRLALRLRGLQLTAMDNVMKTSGMEPHAAARLEWKEDFDLADHSKLFKPPPCIKTEVWMQEEMTLLCMLNTIERVRDLKVCQPHFEQLRDWMIMEIKRAEDGIYPLLGKDAQKFLTMSSSHRDKLIEEMFAKLLTMSAKGFVVVGTKRIYDNCEAIVKGERDALDILMEGDVLTRIYDAVSFDKSDFFRLLCHSKPMLKVLEVGAGTGGTTQMILRELIPADTLPCYSLYTFTDISAGFFAQAKDRFSYAPNMDYRVFDISQSPFEQGFEADTYDIIVAANVVHATPSLNQTLKNLQPLLRPGGALVLTELCAEVRTPNYIFGNFSGWWLGEADGRPYEPYVSVQRWDDELKSAGFSGTDTVVCDAEAPYHYCAAIVSHRAADPAPTTNNSITVLCDHPESGIAKKFIEDLTRSGIPVKACRLGQPINADQSIISLLDLESYFFEDITEGRLVAFQQILKDYGQNLPILWVLRPTQFKCEDPRSGHAIGVARSIRAESPIPFYTLEISQSEDKFSELVLGVWNKLLNLDDSDILSPDKEYVVDNGVIQVGRYQSFSMQNELSQLRASDSSSDTVCSLQIPIVGHMDSLQWVTASFDLATGDHEVLLDVRAIGLNSKDIPYASGILKSHSDDIPFGLEVAGVVRHVGKYVQDLNAGDRVLAMPPNACAKTSVVVPVDLVQRIPDGLTFEDAAALPICYSTAIEGLINLGQLEKGQSVLIHSASGGVGQAAIRICQMIGAKIYATEGSQAKIQYLTSTFGIPREHIFHSRDDSFASNLMQATAGHGVDIVLNSLSGELLHASWDCVAEFGKLIELGKKDAIEFGKLNMSNFLANRSYCCVDMTHLAKKRSSRVKRILEMLLRWLSEGNLSLIASTTVFDPQNAQDAFRHVQNSEHNGKAVIRVPSDFADVPTTPASAQLTLKSDASYLLTGGLGGLGNVISTWLVERGARSLVFLSPSAGAAKNQPFIRELESTGCSVTAISGKAESAEDVSRAVRAAPCPIRGVIHLAMVLKDSPIASMSHADWNAANQPKVSGAWNIHSAFDKKDLDFFVLASSVVTVVEQPGQGNYSAANTYLEAFCQWRRNLSLAASIINICPIEGVGFVAENPFARKNMKAQGLYFLGESELLDFFEAAILNSEPARHARLVEEVGSAWRSTGQVIMGLRSEGDLNDPNTRTNWRRDRRMGFFHNSTQKVEGTAGTSNELKIFLEAVRDDPSVLAEPQSIMYLATEIGRKVYDFMLKDAEDLDVSMSLVQIGLDSLMASELRRWWKMALGQQISVLEIMGSGSIKSLGELAARQLQGGV